MNYTFNLALTWFICVIFMNVLWILIIKLMNMINEDSFKRHTIYIYFKSGLLSVILWIINLSSTTFFLYTLTIN